MLFLLCSVLVLFSTSIDAELLGAPSLKWSLELEGGRTLGKGNSVKVWNNYIFVTATDASLHILDKESGTTNAILEGPSATATCQSGVAIVQEEQNEEDVSPVVDDTTNNNGPQDASESPSVSPTVLATTKTMDPYLVYAVTIPSTNANNSTFSRILAVNIEDATIRWSVKVPGTIVGTPVVGKSGRFIYVSHHTTNTTTIANGGGQDNADTTQETEAGFLSVIAIDAMHAFAELTATLAPPDNRIVPLGPPALQRLSPQGATQVTDGDFVAIAENWDNGFAAEGSLYILAPSTDWKDFAGLGNVSYEWRVVSASAWRFSAVTAPIFVDQSVYIGGTAAIIAGWTADADIGDVLSGRNQNIDPQWILQLRQNIDDQSQRKSIMSE
jgi:hypothetical protein